MTVRFASGGETMRPINAGHRLAVVTVAAEGYDPEPAFYIQLDGPLDGAAPFNHQGEVLLDNATNRGADC